MSPSDIVSCCCQAKDFSASRSPNTGADLVSGLPKQAEIIASSQHANGAGFRRRCRRRISFERTSAFAGHFIAACGACQRNVTICSLSPYDGRRRGFAVISEPIDRRPGSHLRRRAFLRYHHRYGNIAAACTSKVGHDFEGCSSHRVGRHFSSWLRVARGARLWSRAKFYFSSSSGPSAINVDIRSSRASCDEPLYFVAERPS